MTNSTPKMALLRDKSLIGHTILAIAAAMTAWIAWATPTLFSTGNETVAMVQGSADALSTIRWREERYEVTLTRATAESISVSVQSLEGEQGSTEPAAVKRYPGSESAHKLFEEFAPLEAARSLGLVDKSMLAAYGLESPLQSLTLTFDATEEITIPIGAATFGSGDRYAQGPSGEVYILKNSLLSGLLHGASAMLDRSVLGIAAEDIQRVVINTGVQSRELIQRYGEDRDRAYFADPAVPDVKLDKVTAWIDRLLKLRVVDVKQPRPAGSAQAIVDLFNGNKKLGRIELWNTTETSAIALSSRFDGPIAVNKAAVELVLNDLESVLQER